MKKNLLKAIGIIFLAYIILSWIIPTGYFNNGDFVSGSVNPVGIFDVISYPLIAATSSIFILSAIIVLLIGGFYSVLNKTGSYSKWIDSVAKKFKGKEKIFLVLSVLILSCLTSLTGLSLLMFALVPLFAAILMNLGYSKITAMLATIGSILVGNMASICGANVAGYLVYLTNNITSGILYRIVMFILFVAILLFVILKTAKLTKNNKEEIPLYEKSSSKKISTKPMIILFVITFIVLIIGLFNFESVFGIKFFTNIDTAIKGFKIAGYPIFKNLLGIMPAIGAWTNYEFGMVLILSSIIIGKIYKLSFKEIGLAFLDGMKKMLKPAAFVVLANLIFLLMNSNSDGYNIFAPIANYMFKLSNSLNPLILGITTTIGSVLYNDFPYFLGAIYYPISTITKDFTLVQIITPSIHGLVQLISPTSVILVLGLTYFDIKYTDWLKKWWKLFLLLFIAIILIVLASLIL